MNKKTVLLAGLTIFGALVSAPLMAEPTLHDPSADACKACLNCQKGTCIQKIKEEKTYNRYDKKYRNRNHEAIATPRDLESMDMFLEKNPDIAMTLRNHPELINDRNYQHNHPALVEFLKTHPKAKADFLNNPNQVSAPYWNKEKRAWYNRK